jgi:hypothetical protein
VLVFDEVALNVFGLSGPTSATFYLEGGPYDGQLVGCFSSANILNLILVREELAYW